MNLECKEMILRYGNVTLNMDYVKHIQMTVFSYIIVKYKDDTMDRFKCTRFNYENPVVISKDKLKEDGYEPDVSEISKTSSDSEESSDLEVYDDYD